MGENGKLQFTQLGCIVYVGSASKGGDVNESELPINALAVFLGWLLEIVQALVMWLNLLRERYLESRDEAPDGLCQRNLLSAVVEPNLRTTRKENDSTACTNPGAENKVALQLNRERDIHVELAKGNNCIQSAGFVYKT